MPELTFLEFRRRFDEEVTAGEITWEAFGFYGADRHIYRFGTDTKVISTVFETRAAPVIAKIAAAFAYDVEGSEQTIYPDFTLTPKENGPRIAIDVKTTYRRFGRDNRLLPFRYTLGSYTSFLRSPGAAKNIKYPYAEYGHHWILGFLYSRREGISAKASFDPVSSREADKLAMLESSYYDVDYFIQEKYKIVGLVPASGNTTNIGSFPAASLDEFREGTGPFAKVGQKICDEYWRHFPARAAQRVYSTVESFLEWQQNQQEEEGDAGELAT